MFFCLVVTIFVSFHIFLVYLCCLRKPYCCCHIVKCCIFLASNNHSHVKHVIWLNPFLQVERTELSSVMLSPILWHFSLCQSKLNLLWHKMRHLKNLLNQSFKLREYTFKILAFTWDQTPSQSTITVMFMVSNTNR